ncbi:glycyl-tRNA synthetase [Acholeplasma morum]|jgi:glycyl-tRNA synthetase|uniref:glycine--tRNA ligase n=1 Tax=Paracholeplasma morum TaxID=264637 RepID=UPI00195CB6E1|nr:glycine--tRNA ligase [Paracholeplasma morum]MBM7453559.1 glycyl-tRNA synthetase [Paracholeplasma morum]
MISLEKLTTYAKQTGFIYQGSELYGGLANTWDYGPLGSLLKNNIKKAWLKKFHDENRYNVLLDSSILMNSQVWVASGHVGGFSDPLTECKFCNTRHRADKLIEEHTNFTVNPSSWTNDELHKYLMDNQVGCPNCGKVGWTEIRAFNLMFKTSQGVTESAGNTVYLRPETAQGIFINFKNIQRTTRRKVPFGVCQVGKSFRNEITPGNFIFRTREFEQMELEFFCKPGTEIEWFNYWRNYCINWLKDLGLKQENLQLHDHDPKELSHYSNATTDILFNFPWGFDELWGIASRTNFDLNAHQTQSKESLEYLDPETNERYLPYVVEPSVGVERLLMAFLTQAYEEETLADGQIREVLKIHPALAPYQVAILPLIKKRHEEKSLELLEIVSKFTQTTYDETQNIGKRYRRQDQIGTPLCITVDDETLEQNTVTVRFRDTMLQEKVAVADLQAFIQKHVSF